MTVQTILLLILLIGMIAVGGWKGFKSFIGLLSNFFILFFALIIMAVGVNPIVVTLVLSIAITSITLFFTSGFNEKTIAACVAVLLTVVITLFLTLHMGNAAQIQGFSPEQYESFSSFSFGNTLDFKKIIVCEMIIGLLGAVIDVAISITSPLQEIYQHQSTMSRKALFRSGMEIGSDILGTMTNTLLFAYLGGFITLILWFVQFNYAFAHIINSKVFCSEVFQILSSGIGILLVIPLSAWCMAYMLIPQQWRQVGGK